MTPAFGPLRVFDDAAALAQGGTTFLCERAEAQAAGFTVCLSGGSTPRRLYKVLATSPLLEQFPWGRTQFTFGDERFVSPDDPASNARMATEAMFSRAPVPPENVHRVPTVGMTPNQAAAEYERTLKALHGGHAPTPAQPLFDLFSSASAMTATLRRCCRTRRCSKSVTAGSGSSRTGVRRHASR